MRYDVGMDRPRVGVLLVGGFLGAGKTTLLRHLVADPSLGPKLAVLVNELGALGLDGELVRAAQTSATLRSVQLDSGCLCCTLRGELGDALLELARPELGAPPEQIVVELSGAALASEVHFQIATQALDAPYYADGLVCVVDAQQAPRWMREAEGLFLDQLIHADLVLLSKLDVATRDERRATEALIADRAPGARVVPCTRGDIDSALLLGLRTTSVPPAHAHGVKHSLQGETVLLPGPLSRAALEALLEDTTPSLYRIKGLADVIDDGQVRPTWVQCVGDQIELAEAGPRTEPRRLIFIGPSIDRAELESRVKAAYR
jgi:G3E family GTPase